MRINLIFEIFIGVKRFKTVAEQLNAEGHRTSNNSLFTGQSVSRILKDKTHLENSTVTQELWDHCQEILAAKKRSGSSKRRVAHLCSGLLNCSCGQTMYVPTNSKKYVCSKCRNKIAKDDLETIIVQNLKLVGSPEAQSAVEQWAVLSFEQRREIVEATIEQIIAEGKKMTVSLYSF